jgi:hypothetical protein
MRLSLNGIMELLLMTSPLLLLAVLSVTLWLRPLKNLLSNQLSRRDVFTELLLILWTLEVIWMARVVGLYRSRTILHVIFGWKRCRIRRALLSLIL